MERARSISVLIVEDDEDIRDTVADILRDEGYEVLTACNGADALELLRRVRPDVMLLDLTMPEMDGTELRARQLADPALADIPTIVMTAADKVDQRTAAMRVAAALAKPVRMDTLLDTIARTARRR